MLVSLHNSQDSKKLFYFCAVCFMYGDYVKNTLLVVQHVYDDMYSTCFWGICKEIHSCTGLIKTEFIQTKRFVILGVSPKIQNC